MAMHRALNRLLHPLRERAIQALTRGRGVSRVVNGVPMRVDSRARRTFTTDYDAKVADYLRRHVAAGSEVWNVGANVGVFALQLAHWVGPQGRVVAFEPNPAAASMLARNVKLNGLEDRIEIARVAVGRAPGTVEFFVSGTDGMGRAGVPNPLLTGAKPVTVAVTSLDQEAVRRGRMPALVMMDIEGWEIPALQGAETLIAHTTFVVELHPSAWQWSGHDRHQLEAFLNAHRMEAVPLSGQQDALGELGQVVLVRANRVPRDLETRL
jgi:FkbM family methyltransferase